MKNPKFEQKLRERVVDTAARQSAQPGYGLVMAYNPETNTATVLMSRPGSDMPGEIHTNVPCPVSIGVQSVAPEMGRPCWVIFKDGVQGNPMITHFFSQSYEELDLAKQSHVSNDVPRFMMDL